MINKPKQKLAYLVLGALILVIYWRWFSFINVSHGDWGFFFSDTAKDFLPLSPWDSLTGLGSVDLLVWRSPIDILYSIAGYLDWSKNISEKLLVFWPTLIIGFIGAYKLTYRIYGSTAAAVIGSIVANLNTYYLVGTHFLLYSAGAFVFLAFYLFIEAVEQRDKKYFILASLTLFLAGAYDLRVFYLAVPLLMLYVFFDFIMNKRGVNIWRRVLILAPGYALFAVTILLTNLYWIIAATTSGSLLNNETLNRSLFGSEFWGLQNALALSHPFWTGGASSWFTPQDVKWYLWLIPLVAILGLFLQRRRWQVLYFGVIALVGILLAKQVDQPLTTLYPWLFAHMPGFSAFRESTKFYFLIVISYSVLAAGFIAWLITRFPQKKWKIVPIGAIAIIGGLFLTNAKPIMTGEIGTLHTERKIPHDYVALREFLSKDHEYSRTLWVPRDSRWSVNTANHPKINSTEIARSTWNSYSRREKNEASVEESMAVLSTPNAKELLASAAIKYVVVPLQDTSNNDDFFASYEHGRDYYINSLDKIPYLERINLGTKELVVYRNKSFSPYASAYSGLLHLKSLEEFRNAYSFAASLKMNFNFATGDMPAEGGTYALNDFSTDIRRDGIKEGVFERSFNPLGQKLYMNTNASLLKYRIEDQSLRIYSKEQPNIGTSAGPLLAGATPSKDYLVAKLNPVFNYYLGSGEWIQPLDQASKSERNLGSQTTALKLFTGSGASLLSNGSFEEGAWPTPHKCGQIDAFPSNGTITESQKSNGNKSLEVDLYSYPVCFGSDLSDIEKNPYYLLSFDFKFEGSVKAGYELTFNDADQTVLENNLITSDQSWKTNRQLIQVPKGATKVAVRMITRPENPRRYQGAAYFDNFNFQPLKLEKEVLPNQLPNFTEIKIPNNEETGIRIELPDKGKNLVKNGSFEDTSAEKKVGDCNAYDDKPEIKSKLSDTAAQGNLALELSAKRHAACSAITDIPVKENVPFLLNFAYQSPNSKKANFSLTFNDPQKTVLSQDLKIRDTTWQSHEQTIRAPLGATRASLIFYSYEDQYRSAWQVNRYDDVSLREVPDIWNKYYVVNQPSRQLEVPAGVSFVSVAPSEKNIHISHAKTSFFLSIAETYHPKWALKVGDRSNEITAHLKLNDWQNAWYIDVDKLCRQDKLCKQNPDGTYDMEMVAEFTPQRWFYLGLIISATTLAGCLVYLGFTWRKRRRNRPQLNAPQPSTARANAQTPAPTPPGQPRQSNPNRRPRRHL